MSPPPPSQSPDPPLPSPPPASPFSTASNPTFANRLSTPFITRITLATFGAFVTGLCLGASYGSQTTSLRFRAENSHRFPTTTTGWYMYHKSKNYRVMVGGLKGGGRMGVKVAGWAAGFFAAEEAVDRYRGRRDFVSTSVAGVAVAQGFCVWSGFPLLTALRTLRLGLYTGLGFGLVQDALSLARGRRLDYVDFFLGRDRKREYMDDGII